MLIRPRPGTNHQAERLSFTITASRASVSQCPHAATVGQRESLLRANSLFGFSRHDLHVEPVQVVGVLLRNLNWQAAGVLEHPGDFLVIALVRLDADDLSILQVEREVVLMMRHESNDQPDAEGERAGNNSADPMVGSVLSVPEAGDIGNCDSNRLDRSAFWTGENEILAGESERIVPILRIGLGETRSGDDPQFIGGLRIHWRATIETTSRTATIFLMVPSSLSLPIFANPAAALGSDQAQFAFPCQSLNTV